MLALILVDLIFLVQKAALVQIFVRLVLALKQELALGSLNRVVGVPRAICIFLEEHLVHQLIADHACEAQRVNVFVQLEESANADVAVSVDPRQLGVGDVVVVLVNERRVTHFCSLRLRRGILRQVKRLLQLTQAALDLALVLVG